MNLSTDTLPGRCSVRYLRCNADLGSDPRSGDPPNNYLGIWRAIRQAMLDADPGF